MTAQFAISHFRERAAEQALPQISRAVLNEVAGLVEVLLAENERLKADRDRLDWLFSDLNDESIAAKLLQVGNAYALRVDDCTAFREAIDAARSAAKGQTP